MDGKILKNLLSFQIKKPATQVKMGKMCFKSKTKKCVTTDV